MPFEFEKTPDDEETCCLPTEDMSDEEFAGFCKTPEKIKRLPQGKHEYIDGLTLYIDGANQEWDREGWIARYGYDPGPIWDLMKRKRPIIIAQGRNIEKYITEPAELGKIHP
jgi:hypothetical protein